MRSSMVPVQEYLMAFTLTVWPEAMAPVFGLCLYGGVPPPVQVEDVGCLLQIQAQSADAQRQYQHLVLVATLNRSMISVLCR